MILVCIGDYNNVIVFRNVVAYDCISKDDVKMVADSLKVELSDEDMETIQRRCDKFENFPNMDDIRWLIQDIKENGK